MSLIEKFKNSTPKFSEDVDGYEVLCDVLKENYVKQLIADHYEGRDVYKETYSRNPEDEEVYQGTGVQYLKQNYNTLFGIDWKKAYNDI